MTVLQWFEARSLIVGGILIGIVATLIIRLADWKKVIPWCKANGRFMTGVGIGVVVGAFVVLLFDAQPTDAIAGLIGAFAGIVAAIGGGLWLWQVQEAKSVERTLATIDSSCGFLIAALDDLRYNIARPDFPHIFAGVGAVLEAIQNFHFAAHRYEDHLIELDPIIQDNNYQFEVFLRRLNEKLEEFNAKATAKYGPHLPADVDSKIPLEFTSLCNSLHTQLWNLHMPLMVLAPKSLGSWPADEQAERRKILEDETAGEDRRRKLAEFYASGKGDDDEDLDEIDT